MAFPFLSECNFSAGTLSPFDTEADTESRLDFPHYVTLSGIPSLPMPWHGAYCMRVKLANDGTPADAYVQETGSWDLAASGTIFIRFMFYVTPDITMADADEFAILQLWSATNTVEAGVYINYTTANGLRIGIGETSASSFKQLTTGTWHSFEIKAVIDSGVGNDGTLDAWLDNASFTQVTALDQGAITSGVVGVLSQDAGTTKGNVFFDNIIADDVRISSPVERIPDALLLTASDHAFVGPGKIRRVSLLSGAATDNVIQIFDTDTAYTTDASNMVLELKNIANNEVVDLTDMNIMVKRGCYVSMTGTNPRAMLSFDAVYFDPSLQRVYGQRRTPHKYGA